jgi:site-specific recombinase XerD
MIKRTAKRAGVRGAEDITPHKLRHFFACDFLRRRGDVRSLQLQLGHSDLNTTETYLSYTVEMLSAAYDEAFEKNNETE